MCSRVRADGADPGGVPCVLRLTRYQNLLSADADAGNRGYRDQLNTIGLGFNIDPKTARIPGALKPNSTRETITASTINRRRRPHRQ